MTKRRENDVRDEPPPSPRLTIPSVSGWTWAGICVLVLLTAAIYLPAMRGGELLDDDLLLTRNEIVKSPSGLYQFWFTDKASDYWPVTNSTFWIEWRGFHGLTESTFKSCAARSCVLLARASEYVGSSDGKS